MSDTITLFPPDELAAMAERERAATLSYEQECHLAQYRAALNPGETGVLANCIAIIDTLNEARNEYARLLAVAQLANEAIGILRSARLAQDGNHTPEMVLVNAADTRALLARLTPPEKLCPKS